MKCDKCFEEKDEECFGKLRRGNQVWRRHTCKKCKLQYDYEWRKLNPEKDKAIMKKAQHKHYINHKEEVLAKNGARRKANPLISSSQVRLQRAVKSGKIIKPEVCSICNNAGTIVAHHPDYTKPLDVIWVCKSCHAKIHNSLKENVA
jgi:hypothetical protein